MRFTKMQGIGNDYVYVNCFSQAVPDDPARLSQAMSDRHFGIGSDGLILICPSKIADARMRMFNADGSESEMCGNGIRCVAKYLHDHGICRKSPLTIETGRGVLSLELVVEAGKVTHVRVNMGSPILESERIPTTLTGRPPLEAPIELGEGITLHATCISMGNPHCVIFVDEITDSHVLGIGPRIEKHPAFPRKTNVEFVQMISRNELNMRVWERGSGETLACGTGACAVAVAAVLTGRAKGSIKAHLRGGDLQLDWHGEAEPVFMTGPAVEVYHGEWPHDSSI